VFSGDNILVVKEHPPHNKHWKYPGGYLNLSEDFSKGAMREVYEETGIESRYVQTLALRHSHGGQFGRSNIYVLCLLEALTTEIRLDREIEAAEWVPFQTYRKEYNKTPMVEYVTELVHEHRENEKNGANHEATRRSLGLSERQMQYSLAGTKPFTLYF
jgi:ADP-ribose pyrophosphatase YjhB (NUDIX family)